MYADVGISIHALREEGDQTIYYHNTRARTFLSTPSARRATGAGKQSARLPEPFLSTPSARRATAPDKRQQNIITYFYPRPPRGGRHISLVELGEFDTISLHALREEGDGVLIGRPSHFFLFLSTPSARRATQEFAQKDYRCDNFYPRPPRGGRRSLENLSKQGEQISIHALREEGDRCDLSDTDIR